MPARLVAALILVPLAGFFGPLEPGAQQDQHGRAATAEPPAITTTHPLPRHEGPAQQSLTSQTSPWVVPTWTIGQWWAYDVDRPPHATERMRCGIVWADNHTGRFACDSFRERAYNLLEEGPFLPAGDPHLRLEDGTLVHATGEADLFGFAQPGRSAWTARLFRADLVMTHAPLAPGSSERHVHGASADGLALEAVFTAEAGWFSALSLHDDDRLVVRYALVDHGIGTTVQATRWQLLSMDSVVAKTGEAPLSSHSIKSDGGADRVAMVVSAIASPGTDSQRGGRASASVVGPGGSPYLHADGAAGREAVVWIAADRAGSWQVTASASGGAEASHAEAWAHLLRIRIVPAGPAPTAPAV